MSKQRLHDRHILVTRPAHQSKALCHLISELGGTPIACPAIEIKPYDNDGVNDLLLMQLPSMDIALFISANAVTHTVKQLERMGITWPKSIKVAAIGRATSAALIEYAISVDSCPVDQMTSEGLLAEDLLQTVRGKQVIIFQGLGGRELLAQTLNNRGATVYHAVVYERVCPRKMLDSEWQHWKQLGIDIIVCTSRDSLVNLVNMLGDEGQAWLKTQQLLVVNPRIDELARDLGFHRPARIVSSALDKSIIDGLVSSLT